MVAVTNPASASDKENQDEEGLLLKNVKRGLDRLIRVYW
jgi:hypothetical protein